MNFKLGKGQEAFDVVDGAFAGQKYCQNTIYNVVPTNERHRFEVIKKAKAKTVKKEVSDAKL